MGLHDARFRAAGRCGEAHAERSCCSSSRDGFEVAIYDTLEEFYCAEALEYIRAWQQATADNPVGICGPIGPTEQLPLVARIVNALDLKLHDAHFWGMDEWVENGRPVSMDHPLSFAKADMELCFNRIRPELRMPDKNIHFPVELEAYSQQLRRRALPRHARRAGRGEALGVQRSAEARRRMEGRAAAAGKVSAAQNADHRSASDDRDSKRPHVGRRIRAAGADARGHGRAVRNVEGRLRFDLASRAITTIRSASG